MAIRRLDAPLTLRTILLPTDPSQAFYPGLPAYFYFVKTGLVDLPQTAKPAHIQE